MIRLLVLDIDGVLTDGRLYFGADGSEQKAISYRDVDAVFQARREGMRVALLTGESTPLVDAIANRLQVADVVRGSTDKRSALVALCASLGVPLADTCYVGDGVRDADAIASAGLGLAPADASAEARVAADRALVSRGGAGCVAEAWALIRRVNAQSGTAFAGVNPLGIMQGRLSPPDPRRIQAFPWATWEDEFARAGRIGLDGIEWLFEAERFRENPLWTESGRSRIRALVSSTAVVVPTLCADYFMARPFHRGARADRVTSVAVMNELIPAAASVGVRTILLPVLEEAEVTTAAEAAELHAALRDCVPVARAHDVRIGLETELAAAEYRELVEAADDPVVRAYYDTGNSAAKGYDVAAELRALADLLCGIHIKDRERGAGSVRLGKGAVRFDRVFAALADTAYGGPLVLQTASGAPFLEIAGEHASFVRGLLASTRRA